MRPLPSRRALCRPRAPSRCASPRDRRRARGAGALRLRLQEQGRPAPARRGRQLPAVAARHPAGRGHRPEGQRAPSAQADDKEPFAALAFKIINDPFVGQLTFFRVYSGTLEAARWSSTRPRASASASAASCACTPTSARRSTRSRCGNISAAVGLERRATGDTLCDEKKPIILEKMDFPEPVISIAIEPKTKADLEKLGAALQKLASRGPVLPRPHRRGDGPDHHRRHGRAPPRIIVDRLHARVQGRGQRRQAAGRLPRDDHQRGRGRRQVHPAVRRSRPVRPRRAATSSPASAARAIVFENEIVGGVIPKEFIPAIEKGVERGHGARRPRRLPDGRRQGRRSSTAATTSVDSSEPAFEIAGSLGFQEAAREAGPVLLEPIMAVEVVVARGVHGRRHRRPQLAPRQDLGMEPRGKAQVDRRRGAAGRDVRLRHRPALA